MSGSLDIVKYLVDLGYPIGAESVTNAAISRNLDLLLYLHDRRQSIPADAWTVKMFGVAVQHGGMKWITFLMEHYPEICFVNSWIMEQAAKNGDLECVKYLYSVRQTQEESGHPKDDMKPFHLGESLKHASINGRLEIVQYLLAHTGFNFGELSAANNEACRYGHLAIVKALCSRLKNVDQYDTHPDEEISLNQAIQNAASSGHLEIVEYLRQGGYAKMKNVDFSQCLLGGNIRIAQLAYEDITAAGNIVAVSPLCFDHVLKSNHLDIIKFINEKLIDTGLNRWVTALPISAGLNYPELLVYLLEKRPEFSIPEASSPPKAYHYPDIPENKVKHLCSAIETAYMDSIIGGYYHCLVALYKHFPKHFQRVRFIKLYKQYPSYDINYWFQTTLDIDPDQ
ncbi:hypothetical protein SAMD00019534_008760 [Acytostelium subglobosum LB1]|uniref:hypothetical protein n=1 Tax=Acytostelium subglobosum LB1 TaxID=1410327 RepID=UPI000644962E|nr:hypothetical protein SAMD00019534_008760 [Acytostelium subglobosum LB1]GAM17701.1 hypothetical protein SAMD00019534_008760 [Acytostelium subglobosum LB1]|eukprot:XP_012758297.1 hypothetical protein SAMD00019534_008760 [Acytostelium subglobosum LB1]